MSKFETRASRPSTKRKESRMDQNRAFAEQLDFFFPRFPPKHSEQEFLQVGARTVPLRFVRNEAARRYILRVTREGCARVTVPRRGSLKAAREFLNRHLVWIEKQLQKKELAPCKASEWSHGTEILFRGDKSRVSIDLTSKRICFADQAIPLLGASGNVRAAIERRLRCLAVGELVPRTRELAALHQVAIDRVTVRDQRSRWGSCSARKTISLNWRLIQTPPPVRDYIILHELMHLREMNHSRRFWKQVEAVCPDYAKAENWLKHHSHLLK